LKRDFPDCPSFHSWIISGPLLVLVSRRPELFWKQSSSKRWLIIILYTLCLEEVPDMTEEPTLPLSLSNFLLCGGILRSSNSGEDSTAVKRKADDGSTQNVTSCYCCWNQRRLFGSVANHLAWRWQFPGRRRAASTPLQFQRMGTESSPAICLDGSLALERHGFVFGEPKSEILTSVLVLGRRSHPPI
jgi:hypothetical protein